MESAKGSRNSNNLMLYTKDGTVNFKRRPALRSKTGGWKASSFVIGYEMVEVMVYFGIATTLVIYLSDHMHEGTVKASKNVNNWVGFTWLICIVGSYIADAHFGRFRAFIFFTAIEALGLILLTIVVWTPSLSPKPCTSGAHCEKASTLQVGIFYLALYIVGVGVGGNKSNCCTFGADQFDDHDEEERHAKAPFFNWWMFSVFVGTFIAVTGIVFIQDKVGFRWGYGIMTLLYILSLAIFAFGIPFYRHKDVGDNPLLEIAQVLVASAKRFKLTTPPDSSQLYELDSTSYAPMGKSPIPHTTTFRFLDKAVVKGDTGKPGAPWSLCIVTQVEETKVAMKLMPIWLCILIPTVIISQAHTLFIKQATMLDRQLSPSFKVPAGCLPAVPNVLMAITMVIYDKVLVNILRKFTGLRRGITMAQRAGIGMALQCVTMVVASVVDNKRINVVKDHGLSGDPAAVAPLSMLILLPQYSLLGISIVFFDTALVEMFYEEAPPSMRSTSSSLMFLASGVGNFLSSLLLTITNDISGSHGDGGWVQDNLNSSRLYCYYGFLGVLSVLNMALFVTYSYMYVHEKTVPNVDEDISSDLNNKM